MFLALISWASGCSAGRPIRSAPPGEQYVIVRSELESTKQENLFDAIRQARPFWLTRDTRRGASGDGDVAVYLDEQLIGGGAALRRIPVAATSRVRLLSATEAQVRFGTNNALRPAVLIETERR